MTSRLVRDGDVRMMGVDQLCAYLSMGRNRAMEFGDRAGAKRKIGKRCLYDKRIIDKALDEMPAL